MIVDFFLDRDKKRSNNKLYDKNPLRKICAKRLCNLPTHPPIHSNIMYHFSEGINQNNLCLPEREAGGPLFIINIWYFR